MSIQSESANPNAEEGHQNSAENVPLRESSSAETEEKGCIVEVPFQVPVARFRESVNNPPRKPRNAERRSREFLTPAEVEKVISAAEKTGRHGHRDGTMILIAYRHALRVSELISLRWDQLDLTQGLIHVRRRKNGKERSTGKRGFKKLGI